MNITGLLRTMPLWTSNIYQKLDEKFLNGMHISSEQGKAPAKSSSFNTGTVLPTEFTNTWKNNLQPAMNAPCSMHSLYDFQRELLNVAVEILGKSDTTLTALSNQMVLAKIKTDRPATKQELATAKTLKECIIDLVAKRYQQQNNLPLKEARAAALSTYRQARLNRINNCQSWQVIKQNITHNQHIYTSTQLPAAEMKNDEQNIFATSYKGKGVCCWDTKNTVHATNLWQSRLHINENGHEKTLFSGIRHGVLSPYHVKNPVQRLDGAVNRAKEVLCAALHSKPALMAKALKGEVVTLKVVSTSLLTATKFGKESAMVDDQMQAWKKLVQPDEVLQLTIKNEAGEPQIVKIKADIAAFNFGVNELALKLDFGHRASDSYNTLALQQLFGKNLSPNAKSEGWVGEYLTQNPDNYKIVEELSKQIKEIWQNKLHHKDGGEPYKAAQRIAMLAHEINSVPCWNCKSGKDRTGMLDAEIKREAISLHQGKALTPPGKSLDLEAQEIFQKTLLNSGNLEIQQQNTHGAGSKVIKKIWPDILSLSYQKRIGDLNVWQSVKGLSSLITY